MGLRAALGRSPAGRRPSRRADGGVIQSQLSGLVELARAFGDPQDPQRAPGVPAPGLNFAPRPELIAKGFRGADGYTPIGPGSEQFRRGASVVEAKQSFTLGEVAGPRRRGK
jgi:hypothetical protein